MPDFIEPTPQKNQDDKPGDQVVSLDISVKLYPGEKISLILENIPGEGNVIITEAAEKGDNKDVRLDVGGIKSTQALRLEIIDINAPEASPVHVWEVKLGPR